MEVVGLVLDHPREELLGHHVDRIALPIERLEPNGRRPRDDAAHVGHGEATLPPVLGLVGERGHHRIDQHGERDGGRVGVPRVAVDLDHADLLQHVHLGGGETGAVVLTHRLDHVVDEALGLRGADLPAGHGRRDLTKHRMSEACDFQDGHDGSSSRPNCSTAIRSARRRPGPPPSADRRAAAGTTDRAGCGRRARGSVPGCGRRSPRTARSPRRGRASRR